MARALLTAAATLLALAACDAPSPVRAQPAGPDRQDERNQAPPEPSADVLVERKLGVMGTELIIEVIGPDRAALDRALDAAVLEIQRVEDMMTSWRDSPLVRMNAKAGGGPQVVPAELARLVARGTEISRATDGAFDQTFASVGKLWDFKRDPPLLPDADTIRAALAKVGFDRVAVDLDANTIDLPAGTAIGLGGIAKGYGVDRAMAVLMKHGVEHAFVNAGGDLKALGRKHGELWRVAIRHPRKRGEVLALIPVSNTCLVTSGDYERFFEREGKRYHHILDPRTGYPATGCMSATVLAPDAAFADALATASCVLGTKRALEIVESLPRVEALLVGLDGEVHKSSGLDDGE
ncbi:MAG: FAD:protein FMN transferase [bacterium]|nr:FAD:protein FMN transferase [bacterium]